MYEQNCLFHLSMLIRDYYRIRLNKEELHSLIRTKEIFKLLTNLHRLVKYCKIQCNTCVALTIRAIWVWRDPTLIKVLVI